MNLNKKNPLKNSNFTFSFEKETVFVLTILFWTTKNVYFQNISTNGDSAVSISFTGDFK